MLLIATIAVMPIQLLQDLKKMTDTQKIVKGQKPTCEELFFREWGYETIKNNIETVNKLLQQFITLNVALIGGNIAFLSPSNIAAPYRIVSLFLFFLGLILAFLGVLPYESKVNIDIPDQVKAHKKSALAQKRKFLWSCCSVMGGGLLVASIGVAVHKFA